MVLLFKLLTLVLFVGMILFNFLANSLPLNNRNTGQISDDYPSLFTPSGFTFSIWGIIYLLLGVVVIKILITNKDAFFNNYSMLFLILFFVTCITNVLWLFCWHFDKIMLSTIIMVGFLAALAAITFYLTEMDILTRIAFSVYTGWVSIALIANITILLVKNNIPIFQNKEVLWYVIIMIIGVAMGLVFLFISRNVVYTIVYAWAYFGIFMKHFTKSGYHLTQNFNSFNGILLGLLIIGVALVFFLNEFSVFKKLS